MILEQFRYLSFKLVLCLCLLICPVLPVMAAALEEPSSASMLASMPGTKEGNSFLAELLERIKAMQNYSFDSTLTCYSKAKPVTETGRFYFKNPKMVRFEAVSAGSLSGSIVVRQADGKVRAKSGMFMGMTMGLSPNSKLLRTPNGFNILDSDIATLVESVQKSLLSNLKCLVTDSPAPYPGLERAYILEVMSDPKSVLQRIVLDSENKLPREWSLYEGDKLFSVLRIQKLSALPALSDNLFALNEGGAKSLEGNQNVSERIQEAVSRLGKDSKLSLSLINEAKIAVRALKENCNGLEQEIPLIESSLDSKSGVDSSSQTVETGETRSTIASPINQAVFSKAVSIESISESLSKLERLLAQVDTGAALSRQWHENLAAIKDSTSKLYEICDSKLPDTKLIVLEARKMKMHSLNLESIVIQLPEKI